MFFNCILISIFISIQFVFCNTFDSYSYNNDVNCLACPDKKICIPVDYCADVMVALNEATLPIHRFRQAICGYVGKTPKVCCSEFKDDTNLDPSDRSLRPIGSFSNCGRSLVKTNIPTLGSYPFLARIGFINMNDGTLEYPCTGTILNERTILTTATCALATASDYKLYNVLIGEFDTAENPDCNELFCAHCTRSYNISYIIKHPNFQRESFDYNIALIRVVEPMKFSLTAQPICYSDQQLIFMGNLFTLVGWGKSTRNDETTKQHILPMKILSEQDCGYYINRGLSVELCMIGREEPCSGFSGSPLIYYDRRSYFVIGLLSFGLSCNPNNNQPSVFINIQKYAAWISENS